MILAVVGAAAAPVAAQPRKSDALIDKVIAAYGERERVLGVGSYRVEAALRARARGQEAEVIRIAEGGSRLKVLVRYPNAMEVRVLDGEQAWRGGAASDLVSVQGPPRAAMVLQAARANLPWILEQLKTTARLVESREGRPVLEIPVGEGMVMRAVIDPVTYRIVRSEGVLLFRGQEIRFETEYSDFRTVDGVLFAFHEENYASGTHTGTTMVKNVRLNPTGSALQLPVR